MIGKHKNSHQFYGTTTVGEKGQVVIPAEARKMMHIAKKGEKLLVFGMGPEMIAFAKLSQMEKFASHLSAKLKTVKKMIRKSKSRK